MHSISNLNQNQLNVQKYIQANLQQRVQHPLVISLLLLHYCLTLVFPFWWVNIVINFFTRVQKYKLIDKIHWSAASWWCQSLVFPPTSSHPRFSLEKTSFPKIVSTNNVLSFNGVPYPVQRHTNQKTKGNNLAKLRLMGFYFLAFLKFCIFFIWLIPDHTHTHNQNFGTSGSKAV